MNGLIDVIECIFALIGVMFIAAILIFKVYEWLENIKQKVENRKSGERRRFVNEVAEEVVRRMHILLESKPNGGGGR